VEKGSVTPEEQVLEAIDLQVRENIEKNKHRLIGTILVDQGYMRHSQISEVLKSMEPLFTHLKECAPKRDTEAISRMQKGT